jgi:hypothetical protein
MRYTVYRIIVCSRTKIRMISSIRTSVCVSKPPIYLRSSYFKLLDIKSNYLPGIVQQKRSTVMFPGCNEGGQEVERTVNSRG